MEAKAHVELTLGDVENVGDRIVSRLHPGEKPRPRYLRRSRAVFFPAGISGIAFTFGSPPTGYFWTIRSVTSYAGLDPFLISGQILMALYVGPPPSGNPIVDPTSGFPFMSMGDLVVANMGPPDTTFFSEHSVYIYPGEEIVVVAYSNEGPNVQVGANINFTELPMEPIIRPHTAHY